MNKIEFYKETNFKQTPIGEFPFDWQVVKLKDICIQITDGTHKTPTYVDEGIPFISTQNIVPFRKGFDFSEYKKYISSEEHRELIKRCKPEKGDILISKCGTIGRTKLVDVDYEFSIFVGVALLKLKKDLVSGEYLEQLLNYDPMRVRMEISSPGSTRKTLTINAIENLHIPLPKLEEQYRIAEVLSVVDLAVQRTDMVIAKTERLKKGLMQTLLTRGIGHKEFKDTEIGKIPKTWQIVSLKDVVVEAKSGFACGQRDENGILQLRMDNIDPEGWINMEAGVKVPPPPDVEHYILKPGDILFNNTNSVDLIGKTAIFRGEFPRCVYSNHITRIRVNQKKIVPEWILYLLIRKWELGVFKAICHRHVHQAGINNEDLLRLKIPLPPIEEQQAIVSTILSNDNVLKFQRNEKAKLERIKQGLMDLLLTGKIRIRVS